MNILQLIRIQTSDEGTLGRLDGKYYTMECPWRNNNNHTPWSCIPPGSYTCKWMNHPKHGWCYEVTNVDNRIAILIHVGNWGGDTTLGYKSDFEGCIGLGNDIGRAVPENYTKEQEMINGSRVTVDAFNTAMNQEDFTLEIIDQIDYEDQELSNGVEEVGII